MGWSAGIDWDVPWLSPYAELAQQLGGCQDPLDWRERYKQSAAERKIQNEQGLDIHFVDQQALPHGEAYEQHIWQSGAVPTRDNLHDYFNALMWLHYPKIKARLNALQAAAIAEHGTKKRGGLRDAATLFDENAAFLVYSNPKFPNFLCEHAWSELLFENRQAWGKSCQVWLFGHALLEKLVQPFKAITAHTWVLEVATNFFEWPRELQLEYLDQIISGKLTSSLSTRDFSPLPVLGIPGWSVNQDPAFYHDQTVFRPKRTAA